MAAQVRRNLLHLVKSALQLQQLSALVITANVRDNELQPFIPYRGLAAAWLVWVGNSGLYKLTTLAVPVDRLWNLHLCEELQKLLCQNNFDII